MPVSYQFVIDDQAVPLAKVDDWICYQIDIDPDPEQFHYVFHMITDGFLAALIKNGGSWIKCEHLNWILSIAEQDENPDIATMFCLVAEKYDFKAWR